MSQQSLTVLFVSQTWPYLLAHGYVACFCSDVRGRHRKVHL